MSAYVNTNTDKSKII